MLDQFDSYSTARFVEDENGLLLATIQRHDDFYRCIRPAGSVGRRLPDAHFPASDGALIEWRTEAVQLGLIGRRKLPEYRLLIYLPVPPGAAFRDLRIRRWALSRRFVDDKQEQEAQEEF